jgi:hypothetical protein
LNELHEQSIEVFHDKIVIIGERFADHFHAFLDAEHGLLVGVSKYADDELIDQVKSAFDNVDVTVGQGIKTSGVDRSTHIFSLESTTTLAPPGVARGLR